MRYVLLVLLACCYTPATNFASELGVRRFCRTRTPYDQFAYVLTDRYGIHGMLFDRSVRVSQPLTITFHDAALQFHRSGNTTQFSFQWLSHNRAEILLVEGEYVFNVEVTCQIRHL